VCDAKRGTRRAVRPGPGDSPTELVELSRSRRDATGPSTRESLTGQSSDLSAYRRERGPAVNCPVALRQGLPPRMRSRRVSSRRCPRHDQLLPTTAATGKPSRWISFELLTELGLRAIVETGGRRAQSGRSLGNRVTYSSTQGGCWGREGWHWATALMKRVPRIVHDLPTEGRERRMRRLWTCASYEGRSIDSYAKESGGRRAGSSR
jgi:hypothetical protein